MDQNQDRMIVTPRWEAKDVWRMAHILGAVLLIITVWTGAVRHQDASSRPAAARVAAQPQAAPAADPGSRPLYWIRRINAPSQGTEPARALWITP